MARLKVPARTRNNGRIQTASKSAAKKPVAKKSATKKSATTTRSAKQSGLADLKVDQLRARARRLGLSGGSQMRKDQLIKAVTKAGSGSSAGRTGSNGAASRRTGGSTKSSTSSKSTTSRSKAGSGLADMSADQLRARGKRLGLSGLSKMRKDDLIKTINKAGGNGSRSRAATSTKSGKSTTSKSTTSKSKAGSGLADMSADQLRARGKRLGLTGLSKMRKDDLIKTINKAGGKSASSKSTTSRSKASGGLADMSADQLRARGKRLGLSGLSKMRKDDLIKTINKAGGKSASSKSATSKSTASKSATSRSKAGSGLADMSADQLRARGKRLGLTGLSKMRKDDLIKTINKAGGTKSNGAKTSSTAKKSTTAKTSATAKKPTSAARSRSTSTTTSRATPARSSTTRSSTARSSAARSSTARSSTAKSRPSTAKSGTTRSGAAKAGTARSRSKAGTIPGQRTAESAGARMGAQPDLESAYSRDATAGTRYPEESLTRGEHGPERPVPDMAINRYGVTPVP
ncbi:hypothetical protein HII36_31475 [Nonomuraea sp. NN258]|uniref:Rho termination factor N-terminal domain-containing protein n=1 Tax=Nonomuraea antri TaxID=2730852 RepID=UPI001568B646|nr:Rho termination factor N-terminal domain-containing protein [Nonomuraea antri]NRQ36322.1 hypothetical protein [Nonomuraea antri]